MGTFSVNEVCKNKEKSIVMLNRIKKSVICKKKRRNEVRYRESKEINFTIMGSRF